MGNCGLLSAGIWGVLLEEDEGGYPEGIAFRATMGKTFGMGGPRISEGGMATI